MDDENFPPENFFEKFLQQFEKLATRFKLSPVDFALCILIALVVTSTFFVKSPQLVLSTTKNNSSTQDVNALTSLFKKISGQSVANSPTVTQTITPTASNTQTPTTAQANNPTNTPSNTPSPTNNPTATPAPTSSPTPTTAPSNTIVLSDYGLTLSNVKTSFNLSPNPGPNRSYDTLFTATSTGSNGVSFYGNPYVHFNPAAFGLTSSQNSLTVEIQLNSGIGAGTYNTSVKFDSTVNGVTKTYEMPIQVSVTTQ